MLRTIDILIGAITVLLIFSMAVTVITQAITALLNRKGRHLKDGITVLLGQLGISDTNIAKTIAEKLLTHPMIAVDGKLGNVIHREEFTKLLLDLSSGQGTATLKDDAKAALLDALKRGGIADPAEALKNIHDMALRLESSNPEIANHVRDGLAVLHGAPSEFVARVHSWFDQSIDRVSDRFTNYTHAVVVGVSLVVVLFVQLDIIALVQRLSIDEQFRNSLVAQATNDFSNQVTATNHEASGGAPLPTLDSCRTDTVKNEIKQVSDDARAKAKNDGKTDAEADKAAKQAEAAAIDKCRGVSPQPYYDLLNKAGLITIPDGSLHNWAVQLKEGRKWPGMFISVLLLSLGAPFWYKVLAQFLQLRSAVAGKDDAQRQQRQGGVPANTEASASNTGSGTRGAAASANLPVGETGDLTAVG
jgi:hypothetical protein